MRDLYNTGATHGATATRAIQCVFEVGSQIGLLDTFSTKKVHTNWNMHGMGIQSHREGTAGVLDGF